MEDGMQERKEVELENVLVDAREKSFLELLCEADPTIQLQAWEMFGAYSPGYLSSSLTPWVPPSKMGPAGENAKLELRGALNNFRFSEAERFNANAAEKIKMRGRVSRTSEPKFKHLFKSDMKPQKDVSWFNVNLRKDHLKERIAELYKLVNESRTTVPGLAAVLQETKELIVSLLDELKVLSSFYIQHSGTSSQLLGREHMWTNGLTSIGLCLVPISTAAHSPIIKRQSIPSQKDGQI